MKRNWRTNLGGAISVTGTSLIGIGLLGQTQKQTNFLWWVACTGFVLSAMGKGVTALFAADAAQVKDVAVELDRVNALGTDPNSKPLVPAVPVKPNPPIP